MVDSATIRYGDNALRPLLDGLNGNTIVTFLKKATYETTIGVFIPIHGAVEDILKQAVKHGAADNATSSRLDRLTDF